MFAKTQLIEDLSLSITQNLGLDKESPEHSKVYELCIQYVLKLISASNFQNSIRSIVKKTCNKFRLDLIQSLYVLRNLKAFVLSLSRNLLNPVNLAYKFQISKSDLEACLKISNFISCLKFESRIIAQVSNVTALDKRLSSIIIDIQDYCNRFVRKKLLFVLRSCNFEVHDLSGELLCKAIATFYHTSIEGRSKLHTLNFLRMTCKNHGTNMINYFTAKKRSRLVQVGTEGKEFSLTIVSENQLHLQSNGDEVSYDSLSGGCDNTDNIILNRSVSQVVSSIENEKGSSISGTTKIEFIKLLMGYYSKGFTDYLHSKGIKYSNDEYIDRIKTTRYIDLVANYLEVDRLSSKTLILSLRKKLA